jgi:5-methyltetrahydrofolate--homocysteine methyltransferase
VKIAPKYSGDIVHVLDASRAAGVVEKLINPATEDGFSRDNRASQVRDVENFKRRQQATLVPLAEALRETVDDRLVDGPDRRAVVPGNQLSRHDPPG